jgi:hypothetical protein
MSPRVVGTRKLPPIGSKTTTAGRMADAVSFLIRVADEASMHGTARKLVTVRRTLLQIAQSQSATHKAPGKIA